MKRIYEILAYALIVVALCGCNNEGVLGNDDGTIDIPTGNGYIYFDTEVLSRGALVTDNYLMANFGVFGYEYAGTWDAAVVMAKPEVFDEVPEMVEYNKDNGLYSYAETEDGLKTWSGKNYAFFGFYPFYKDDYSVVAPSDANTEGEPYVTFKLPSRDDVTKHVDLMTANLIGTNGASSKNVVLNMRHRLAAIDVGARNYYEYAYEQDGNIYIDPVTIEVKSLKIDVGNLVYDSGVLYLNYSKGWKSKVEAPNKTANYIIVPENSTKDVAPNTKKDTSLRLISTQSGNDATSMLVIPQEGASNLLHITPTLTYKKRLPNGSYLHTKKVTTTRKVTKVENGATIEVEELVDEVVTDKVYEEGVDELGTTTTSGLDEKGPTIITTTNSVEFTYDKKISFDRDLLEGRRYYIQFTFTANAVSVNIVAADEWNELEDDIYHDFD